MVASEVVDCVEEEFFVCVLSVGIVVEAERVAVAFGGVVSVFDHVAVGDYNHFGGFARLFESHSGDGGERGGEAVAPHRLE